MPQAIIRIKLLCNSKVAVALICLAAASLHLGVMVFKSDPATRELPFLIGLWCWSMLPYLLGAGGWLWRGRPLLAMGAVVACIAVDGLMHHAVFHAPAGSTAALGLLVAPLLNLVVSLPAGSALAWLVARTVAK